MTPAVALVGGHEDTVRTQLFLDNVSEIGRRVAVHSREVEPARRDAVQAIKPGSRWLLHVDTHNSVVQNTREDRR